MYKSVILTMVLTFTPCIAQDLKYDASYSNLVKKEDRQGLSYEIRGAYSNPVKKEKLANARTLSDVRTGYPSSWISNYISTEISVRSNGKTLKAAGTSENLSVEQKKIVALADVGSDIRMTVQFNAKNTVTDKIEVKTLDFSATVVPEKEAEFTGGYQQMMSYVKSHTKISDENAKRLQDANAEAILKFVVNESGDIADVKISKTSGNQLIDQQLQEILHAMPKWRPAEHAKVKVKQEFEFSVRSSGC